MLKEIQKDYYADTKGNIYSKRKFKKLTKIKQYEDKQGYLRVKISQQTKKVHRLIAQTFIPNPENKSTVNHKNGNKKNNTIKNLEWMTRSENTQHAYNTGLKKGYKGYKKSRIGISNTKRKKWYKLHKKGYSYRKIAKIYGVSHHTIILNIKKYGALFHR